jgi:hypothetical protein
MSNGKSDSAGNDPVVRKEVEELLKRAPSFQHLDALTREQLADSMTRFASALAAERGRRGPLAAQLAPSIADRMRSEGGGGGITGSPTTTQPGAAPPPSASPAAGSAPASGGPTGRVGEVARATLNAIDFPSFVASLIQGTFQAIVDSSIQQMEAYAELLKNTAGTLDRFMNDHVSEGNAYDFLAEEYGSVFSRDSSRGAPRLQVNPNRKEDAALPSFFKDLGFATAGDIDDDAIEQVIVPAARRQLAERRQQTLATMVLMGINRVVVDDGEISAKLQFHIDASETTALRFDQTKTSVGNMSGTAGRSPFTAQGVMVNTTSLNAQSDINIRTDLTGQVKVKFRSETFPLERFADSAAIQLINSNAKVPQPAPAAAGAAPAAAGPTPAAAPALPPAAPPAAVATQGLSAAQSAATHSGADPWAPDE